MNPINHQLAVQLAAAIYQPTHADVRKAISLTGICPSVAEIVEGPAPLFERAMIVPTADVLFVVFRGTQNKRQWLGNFNGRKEGWFGGKVHRGFLTGFCSIRKDVLKIAKAWRGKRPLVIVGHSRGAAEAILFANIARIMLYRVSEIHLFGCPRTLSRRFAAKFDKLFPNTFNWIANNDAVHRVPFKWMGFRHVGSRMYFDSKGRLRVDPDWKIKVRGQIMGRIRGGPFDGWSDHNAAKEYKRLIGNLEFKGD
jgi:pimeloyl-ACP methyl ester carboxylesterase